ncbi:FRG domain-containing protein [Pseudomonas aeruginosa]|uniref:FRG domain-containing protein n=1 Tax=Pseudomonas aeruginosa TaxID=287 RepID=UPI00376F0AA6
MSGNFHLKKSNDGGYLFTLRAKNGEILLASSTFPNFESAKAAIFKITKNKDIDSNYEIKESKNGKCYFTINTEDGKILAQSQMYASRVSALRGISAVKDYATLKSPSILDSQGGEKSTSKIGSVRTFISVIEGIEQDATSVIFYRGHGNHTYKLTPSLYRNSGWVRNEHVIFHELVLRCPSDFELSGSTFNILVKMQHYSLPTRLLDITTNPLVALYFACTGGGTADAEVIMFRIPKDEIRYYDSDRVSVISNIGRLPSHSRFPQKTSLEKFNENEDIIKLVREIQREKPYFEARINPSDVSSVVCVKPVLDNPRIIKQDGAFLLFGVNKEKANPAEVPQKYLLSNDDFRLIITGKEKAKILEQLSSLGITRSTIYPEIEHVAGYLSEKYKD